MTDDYQDCTGLVVELVDEQTKMRVGRAFAGGGFGYRVGHTVHVPSCAGWPHGYTGEVVSGERIENLLRLMLRRARNNA